MDMMQTTGRFTDAAGTVTVTRFLTIGGANVATKTTTGAGTSVAWNCGSLQNSTVCQADAASPGVVPARKRYAPYGGDRNAVTFTTTDHQFLGQPDDSTGLTYLNNRYYDPAVGVFVSVDPLVGKTGTPYLYGAGNPSTLSDPSGLSPDDVCAAQQQSGQAVSDGVYSSACSWARHYEAVGTADKQANAKMSKPKSQRPSPATVAFTPQSPARQLSEAAADQILEQGRDLSKGADSGRLAVGGCFSATWVVGSFDGCIVATNVDIGTTTTVSAGRVGEDAGLTAGVIVSNAQSLDELAGPTACVSASGGFGGGASGTVCASLDPKTSLPTGVMTVYVGVGVTTSGVTLTYGVTEVSAWGSTPFFVRWFLPGFGGDDGPYISHWGDDPLHENFQGRWSSGSAQTCFYTAGNPC